MKAKDKRQENLLNILVNQGTGIVSMSDDKLSVISGIPKRTLSRDLEEMNYRKIIIKDTKLIKNSDGNTRKQRDIIIPQHAETDEVIETEWEDVRAKGTELIPVWKENENGYVVMDKDNGMNGYRLADVGELLGQQGKVNVVGCEEKKIQYRRFSLEQHRFLSNIENHKVILKNGEVQWHRRPTGLTWERNMSEKEFRNEDQAWSWIYSAIYSHNERYKGGDNYINRAGIG